MIGTLLLTLAPPVSGLVSWECFPPSGCAEPTLRRDRTVPVWLITMVGTLVSWVIRTLQDPLVVFGITPCRNMTLLPYLCMVIPQPRMFRSEPVKLASLRQRAVNRAWDPSLLRRHLVMV